MRFLPFALIVVLATGVLAAGTTGLTEPEMRAGRKLYTAKCARCHKFYDPARYSETEWHEWMDKMGRKAKLKSDQKELLSRYLETYRGESRTNRAAPPAGPR